MDSKLTQICGDPDTLPSPNEEAPKHSPEAAESVSEEVPTKSQESATVLDLPAGHGSHVEDNAKLTTDKEDSNTEEESKSSSNRPAEQNNYLEDTQATADRELDSDTEEPYKPSLNKKPKARLIMDDSDSEEEVSNHLESDKEEGFQEKPLLVRAHKRITLVDSDSESEEAPIVPPHDKSFTEGHNDSGIGSSQPVVDVTNSQRDIALEDQQLQKSRLSTLCDSDSDIETAPSPPPVVQPAKHKPKKTIFLEDTHKPTSVKEAQEQRKIIQSESQRMLREKNIALPYHKPKTRSLQEFLARRPKLSKATCDSAKAPPSVAMKMSMNQLEEIAKKLKEREIEVKEFYKSESESDGGDDGDEDYVPPINENCDEVTVQEPPPVEQTAEMDNPPNDEVVAPDTTLKDVPDTVNEPLEKEPEATIKEAPVDNSAEAYAFNLEDVDTAEPLDETTGSSCRNFTYTDLDKEIENFGQKSRLELLKERLANEPLPKLTGAPDDLIDLDLGPAKPQEVVQLMERFAKHVQTNRKKHQPQHKVKLSVVTVEPGGDILKEEVAMNVESDEESPATEEIPGAKLQKLKEELQRQMELKKAEIWQQKAAKGIRAAGESVEEEEGEKDILDDEDEEDEELTDEEEEGDLEEDDVDMTEGPRGKCAFADDEAEESDPDEQETLADKEGYKSDSMEAQGDSEEQFQEAGETKRVLKRIVKPANDSDDEDLLGDSHLDSTVTATDEEDIPSHQVPPARTPIRQDITQGKSINDFLTPISFITSIQNLNTASKSNVVSPFKMPSDLRNDALTRENLFTQSQASSVSSNQETSSSLNFELQSDEAPTTQDLLAVCSGQFTGISQVDSAESGLTAISGLGATQSSELKGLGEDDMVISQLLDEEELENFKKKFESPVNPTKKVGETILGAEEVVGGGVIDSDDDEDGTDIGVGRKRKLNRQKRIQFSDDENSSDEESNDETEEVIDLQDADDDEGHEIDNVGYDSEENEIDLNAEGQKEKVRIADFVEAEAELSESDWDSADEDEKDMDRLEAELGDEEQFDQEKMKSDLEKIHMRRLLDDDNREVKLLQELLLEDGEMHGAGRQRQFKWRNIDLNGDDGDSEKKDDDDIYLEEEESEEQWRRRRHERETFLNKQKEKNSDSQDLLEGSQILKIGQKMLQRSISLNSSGKEQTTVETSSFFSLQNKRGSFLNRSDHVLQRVAEFSKEEFNLDSSKKTTKHFLFQSVSMCETIEHKKRKADERTPNVLKKLRLSTNLSPAIRKKKSDRAKQLFNF